jgi:serine/threonine protein kinase/Tol biopolymer transport system component
VSLSPGDRIGPYLVVGKIGEGGMGEVFRATDARLKRDVALKVLPASAVGDPEKRRRFEREAQVLAALNHPAIAQIYGVELDGDEPIIVMEHVDGDTLADRLAKGALPIDDVIAIGLQICDGLEAAHERHVIHRDLKPANIKIRPDGTIKILDFGIARVLATDTAVDTANSPTMLGGSTDAGIILGTAAYMSPEQARGRAVDKRADIWAFGCIVYEMLAGKPAFSGESTTDILADIVKNDPDWTRLPAATPHRLVDVLKRCLQKHARDRLRDIGDARFEIERANDPELRTADASSAPSRSRMAGAAWFAAGAALGAAVLLLASPWRRGETPAPAPVHSTIVLPTNTTLALSRGSAVALSPDGRLLSFTGRSGAKTQLYLRPLDQFEATPLPGTDGASNPFFSPDGRWIGFFANEKLKKVSIDGGAPVTVADALNPRGHAWSVDDTIFVTASNNSGIGRVAARGGKLEPFTRLEQGELSHRWPALLPDGKTVLFSLWNDNGWELSRIAAQGESGGHRTVVEAGGGYPRYIRDDGGKGFLVYGRSEGLLAAPFDERTLTATGQAIPIIDGVLTNLSGGAHFDLSPSGALAYVPGDFAESSRDLVWIGRDGKPVSPPQTFGGLTRTFEVSPDGTRVLRNTHGDIWEDELGSGRTRRLTNTPELGNYSGVWAADGSGVAYARGLAQDVGIFFRTNDGRETQLTSARNSKAPTGTSPDGRYLLYYDLDPATLADIWVVEVSNPQPRPWLKTPANESNARFSPDGRWIAYRSNESGRFEIYVRSFAAGGDAIRISTDGGVSPAWSARTNELFFRGLDGRMMAVTFRAGDRFEAEKPRAMFDATRYENTFSVSPDAQTFALMPLLNSELSSTRINLVQNLLTELRQRVR